MHSFIDKIITFSLKNKFFIFFCTGLSILIGIASFTHTPIDAFPDVTNTKVTIITQWPGRSAEEVEKFITIPIEIAMNSVQKKTDIRSSTLFGLSVVNVMFEDHVDDFFARQQVYNLLNDADLPEGITPEVQPLYGPTGEIFRYTLQSSKRSVRELKTWQDWTIERKLRSVPGVADIVSFGGEVKTFEVSVNPNQLILMVTALGTTDDIVAGLDAGADDYISKPFSFAELQARLRALLRRREPHPSAAILECADLQLNTATRRAYRNGQPIDLTVKECRLLEFFMYNQGSALSRMQLLREVWDKNFDTNTNIVDVYVNYLRSKIDKGFDKKLIHTVVGVGYMMEA